MLAAEVPRDGFARWEGPGPQGRFGCGWLRDFGDARCSRGARHERPPFVLIGTTVFPVQPVTRAQ